MHYPSVNKPDRKLRARQVSFEVRKILGTLRHEYNLNAILTIIRVFWGDVGKTVCKDCEKVDFDTVVCGAQEKKCKLFEL